MQTQRPPLGYCTNVHAGADLLQMRSSLEQHALAVKRLFRPSAPMGLGLWFSARAARQLLTEASVAELREWLAGHGLVPFTLNGFPFGDFHQGRVKHQVYLPTWWEVDRRDYTLELITILDGLLPSGINGSISTLPIAWGGRPSAVPGPELLRLAAQHLREVACALASLERERGRRILLCLEPEPGCVFQYSADIVAFWEQYVLPGIDPVTEAAVRRYLGVCHDICHAAVMFEDQTEVLRRYRGAGICVGKVQVSAAVGLDLRRTASAERSAALAQLSSFAEDRYLHQTVLEEQPGVRRFYEDLPEALPELERVQGAVRVHFHVPIYLERFGHLDVLQQAICECLAELRPEECDHFEVETYAWGVLPVELRQKELAQGIAQEMAWLAARTELRSE